MVQVSVSEPRPVAARTLVLVGVAIQGVALLLLLLSLAFFSPFYGGFQGYGPWMMVSWMIGHTFSNNAVWALMLVISAFGVIGMGIYGAFMMNSSDVVRVRLGATLVLIAAVIAFSTMWGFLLGSLLMLAGGALGFVWTPPQQSPQS